MESTFVYCRRLRYAHAPRIRVRPIPEMQSCAVYDPERAELYRLDGIAWLVFELCTGVTGATIERAYLRIAGETTARDTARAVFRTTLADLLSRGIVRCLRRGRSH